MKITREERIASLLGGSPPRADTAVLVDTLVLMIAADGKLKTGELEEAIAIASKLPGAKGRKPDEMKKWVEDSLTAIKKEGRKARLESLATRLTKNTDREDAFRLAAAVRFADAEVSDDEDLMLVALRGVLNIDEERAEVLVADVESRMFKA